MWAVMKQVSIFHLERFRQALFSRSGCIARDVSLLKLVNVHSLFLCIYEERMGDSTVRRKDAFDEQIQRKRCSIYLFPSVTETDCAVS